MTQNPLSPLRPEGDAQAQQASRVAPRSQAQPGLKTLTPSDIMRLFRRSKLLLVMTLLVSVLIAGGAHYLFFFHYPKHMSVGTMKVEIKDPEVIEKGYFRADAELTEKEIKNHIFNINSQAILSEVVSDPEVRKTAWMKGFITTSGDNEVNREAEILAIKVLKKHLRVFNPKDTQLITISMSGYSIDGDAKGDMKVIVATVIEKYMNAQKQTAVRLIEVDVNEIKNLVDKATKVREGREADISRFMEINNIGSIETELKNLSIDYKSISEQTFGNKIRLKISQSAMEKLKKQAAQGEQNPGAEISQAIEQNPIISRIYSKIIDLNEVLEVKRKKFGDKHAIVAQIEAAIIAAEAQRDEQVARLTRQNIQAGISGHEENIKSLDDLISTSENQLVEIEANTKDLGKLQEEYKLKEARVKASKDHEERTAKAYQNAIASKNQAKNLTISRFRNAQDPEMTFPEFWFSPVLSIFLFGSVVALLFVKEMTDQRFKTPADMRMLPAVKLLGGLPDAGEDPSGSRHIEGAVSQSPSSILSESFRQVRAALEFEMRDRGAKTVMIASAQNGCGVTQVIANLATSFAYAGSKVCIVDANFHSPGQSRAWQLPSQHGLGECINGSINVSEAVQQTSVEGVSVMSTGNTAGMHSEVFNRAKFKAIVAELKEQFDVVLFDSSPMSITSDGALLATEVDSCALVVLAERDTRGLVNRVIRMLNDRNTNFLGVILNGVKASAGGYFQKNYKAYYKYKQVDSRSA